MVLGTSGLNFSLKASSTEQKDFRSRGDLTYAFAPVRLAELVNQGPFEVKRTLSDDMMNK
jgi:hypothetical protein